MNQSFQINGKKDNYIVYDKVLGKGAYGVVLYATAVQQGRQLAAKIINKKSLSPTDIVNLQNEIQIQSQLSHPKIVAMVEAFEDDEYLYMLLEYCSGGCLFTNLQLNGPFKEEKALKYFTQIVKAVNYIHSKGFLHRDIKLSNLLITTGDEVKLADFTWSTETKMGYAAPQICGTLEYMPPEVLSYGYHNEKLDVWSLGIILYEMLHNDYPKDGQFVIKYGISYQCKQLLKLMLEVDSYKRPNTIEILKSSWVKTNSPTQNTYLDISRRISNFSKFSGIAQQQAQQQGSPQVTQIAKIWGAPLGSPLRSSFNSSSSSTLGSPSVYPKKNETEPSRESKYRTEIKN